MLTIDEILINNPEEYYKLSILMFVETFHLLIFHWFSLLNVAEILAPEFFLSQMRCCLNNNVSNVA